MQLLTQQVSPSLQLWTEILNFTGWKDQTIKWLKGVQVRDNLTEADIKQIYTEYFDGKWVAQYFSLFA